jgi:hypothetical protein
MWLQDRGFFDCFDNWDADKYASTDITSREYSTRIALIDIDEDDYRDTFGASSPLNPSRLIHLINRIQSYRPRLIAVDLITDDWPPLQQTDLDPGAPVVWAREPKDTLSVLPKDWTKRVFTWSAVAGYPTKAGVGPPNWLTFAAPINELDEDGSVRWYANTVNIADSGKTATYPTMANVLASSYPGGIKGCPYSPKPGVCRILSTGKDHLFRKLHVSDIEGDLDHHLSAALDGHIVIIGATYAAARDQYESGGGVLNGDELLANEVESDVTGPVRDVPIKISLALSLIVSMALFRVSLHLLPGVDLVVSWICLVVYSLGAGYMLFRYYHYFWPIGSALLSLPIGIVFAHVVECYGEQALHILSGRER